MIVSMDEEGAADKAAIGKRGIKHAQKGGAFRRTGEQVVLRSKGKKTTPLKNPPRHR